MGWREELDQMGQGFTDAALLPGRFAQQLGTGINNLAVNAWNNPKEVLGEAWDAYSNTSPGLNIPGGGVPGSMTSGAKAVIPGLGKLAGVGSKMASQFQEGVKRGIIDPNSDMSALGGLRDKFPKVVDAMERNPVNILWKSAEDPHGIGWGATIPHPESISKNALPGTSRTGATPRRDPTKPAWLVDEKKLNEITNRQAEMTKFAEEKGTPTLRKIVNETQRPLTVEVDPRGPADRQMVNTPLHEALHALYMANGKHGLVPEQYAKKVFMDAMQRAGHDMDYTTQLWDMYNKKGLGGLAHGAIEGMTDAMMKKQGIPNPKRNF